MISVSIVPFSCSRTLFTSRGNLLCPSEYRKCVFTMIRLFAATSFLALLFSAPTRMIVHVGAEDPLAGKTATTVSSQQISSRTTSSDADDQEQPLPPLPELVERYFRAQEAGKQPHKEQGNSRTRRTGALTASSSTAAPSRQTESQALLQRAPKRIGYVLDRKEFQAQLDLGKRYLEGELQDPDVFPIPQFQSAWEQVKGVILEDVVEGRLLSVLSSSTTLSHHQEHQRENAVSAKMNLGRRQDGTTTESRTSRKNMANLLFKKLFFATESEVAGLSSRKTRDIFTDITGDDEFKPTRRKSDGYVRFEIQQLCENDPPDKRAAEFITSKVHTDNYYMGAIYFIVSDSHQFGTTMFHHADDEVGFVAEPFAIYQMDWTGFHSSKPFCSKSVVGGGNSVKIMMPGWTTSVEMVKGKSAGRNNHRGYYLMNKRGDKKISSAPARQRNKLQTSTRKNIYPAASSALSPCVRTFFRVWFYHPVLSVLNYNIHPLYFKYLQKLPETKPRCPALRDRSLSSSCFLPVLEKDSELDQHRSHCHICCNLNTEIGDAVGCWKHLSNLEPAASRNLSWEACCAEDDVVGSSMLQPSTNTEDTVKNELVDERSGAGAGATTSRPPTTSSLFIPSYTTGDAYWGHDYFLSSQQVDSAAQCLQLCVESGNLCGGYTWIKQNSDGGSTSTPNEEMINPEQHASQQHDLDLPPTWQSTILPASLILELRGLCLLRGDIPLAKEMERNFLAGCGGGAAPAPPTFGAMPDIFLHVFRSRGMVSGLRKLALHDSGSGQHENINFELFDNCDVNAQIFDSIAFVSSANECEQKCIEHGSTAGRHNHKSDEGGSLLDGTSPEAKDANEQEMSTTSKACKSYTYILPEFDGDPWSHFSTQFYDKFVQKRCVLKTRRNSEDAWKRTSTAATAPAAAADPISGGQGADRVRDRTSDKEVLLQHRHSFLPDNDFVIVPNSVSGTREEHTGILVPTRILFAGPRGGSTEQQAVSATSAPSEFEIGSTSAARTSTFSQWCFFGDRLVFEFAPPGVLLESIAVTFAQPLMVALRRKNAPARHGGSGSAEDNGANITTESSADASIFAWNHQWSYELLFSRTTSKVIGDRATAIVQPEEQSGDSTTSYSDAAPEDEDLARLSNTESCGTESSSYSNVAKFVFGKNRCPKLFSEHREGVVRLEFRNRSAVTEKDNSVDIDSHDGLHKEDDTKNSKVKGLGFCAVEFLGRPVAGEETDRHAKTAESRSRTTRLFDAINQNLELELQEPRLLPWLPKEKQVKQERTTTSPSPSPLQEKSTVSASSVNQYPPCNEELIGRSSFFKLHYDTEQIRMAQLDCELTSNNHYEYMDTQLVMNNMFSFNLAICFPKTYQDLDPLDTETYCSLESILKKYYRDVGAKCESLRIMSRQRFWPHHHFGVGDGGPRGGASTSFHPKLDFLIAGFARSGSTTVKANLAKNYAEKISMGEELLSFNWPPLLRLHDVKQFREVLFSADVDHRSSASTGHQFGGGNNKAGEALVSSSPRRLIGFKSEAFAFSRHVELVCKAFPEMKLIFVIREPMEWLQSVFNYRVHLRCAMEGIGSSGCSDNEMDAFLQIARGEREFEDCGRRFGKYADILTKDVFPFCGEDRVLLLEFEWLKSDPVTFFQQIELFLGIEEAIKEEKADDNVETGEGQGDDEHAEKEELQPQQPRAAGPRKQRARVLESRNEYDKHAYNYVVRNIFCDDKEFKSSEELAKEDGEIFDTLREYYYGGGKNDRGDNASSDKPDEAEFPGDEGERNGGKSRYSQGSQGSTSIATLVERSQDRLMEMARAATAKTRRNVDGGQEQPAVRRFSVSDKIRYGVTRSKEACFGFWNVNSTGAFRVVDKKSWET
ncbi:unnamed protein product [Amoebophrya sp. A120]|nr:unnamed protein product [Amoebophrya sp. A120]|eukprot:GSA120T00012360001.1